MSITLDYLKVWNDNYLRTLNEQLRRDIRVWRAMQNNPYERKFHWDVVALPEAEIAAQRAFIEQWHTLMELGEKNDWIDFSFDDRDSPSALVTERRIKVWDETDEEWEARKAALPTTVTFQVRR